MPLLARASVGEVKSGEISRSDGYLVVAMRLYPRFLSKDLTNEYSKTLAPAADLFERYREFKKRCGSQNQAFELADYEHEFALTDEGTKELERLSELSRRQSVYLVCQCERNEKCHVDLMLLIAKHRFGASITQLPYDYAEFELKLREPG